MGRKKAETPAPSGLVALQAAIALAAHQDGSVPIDPNAEGTKDLQARLAYLTGNDLEMSAVVARSPAVAAAFLRLSTEDPDAFLKHWANFREFVLPKLARIEHKIEGAIEHQHYVAVERREEAPRVIDSTAEDVTP